MDRLLMITGHKYLLYQTKKNDIYFGMCHFSLVQGVFNYNQCIA